MNISQNGLPSYTFTIYSPNSAAYVDTTGSGSETISRLYENGRVVECDQPEFEVLLTKMGKKRTEGARAMIMLDVFKVW